MIDLLKKLYLKEELNFELNADIHDFIIFMNKKTDTNDNNIARLFSPENCDYIGEIKHNSFLLKRSKNIMETVPNIARIRGAINIEADKLNIHADVMAIYDRKIFSAIALVLAYFIFILLPLASKDFLGMNIWYYLIYFLIDTLLILGFPYFLMRGSMKRLKYHITEDFKQIEKFNFKAK